MQLRCLLADQQQAEQSGREVEAPFGAQAPALLTTVSITFTLGNNALQHTTNRTNSSNPGHGAVWADSGLLHTALRKGTRPQLSSNGSAIACCVKCSVLPTVCRGCCGSRSPSWTLVRVYYRHVHPLQQPLLTPGRKQYLVLSAPRRRCAAALQQLHWSCQLPRCCQQP